MRKLFILVAIAASVISCKEEKKATLNTKAPEEKNSNSAATSSNDEMLTAWLKGKMMTSEKPEMDYNNFKLFADGSCVDKGAAKSTWEVKNGELIIASMMKFKIDKKDEQTLILHRSLSDETYKLVALP